MVLISKKQLLEQTGISYGQLYRWKRQGLIPEDWFIKKSSFTGQETFFERERILERVYAILKWKDQYSLEELAALFSCAGKREISVAECARMAESSEAQKKIALAAAGQTSLCVEEAALLLWLMELEDKGKIPDGRAALVWQENRALASLPRQKGMLFLTAHTYFMVWSCADSRLEADRTVEMIAQFQISVAVDHLQRQMQKIDAHMEEMN